jgi:hypothetical protein
MDTAARPCRQNGFQYLAFSEEACLANKKHYGEVQRRSASSAHFSQKKEKLSTFACDLI